MHEHDFKITTGKGLLVSASTGASYLATIIVDLDPIIRVVMLIGGAIGVILTIVSMSLDIRRKVHVWRREGKFKNDGDEPTTKL